VSDSAPALLEHLFRRQAGRIVAHLTRLLGPACLDLAEEAVQDTMVKALQSWPCQGLPDNPAVGS
jgi:RNA polymerase sigma-70 factor (ECF subfamily)